MQTIRVLRRPPKRHINGFAMRITPVSLPSTLLGLAVAILSGCGTPPITPSEQHLKPSPAAPAGDIPKPVQQTQLLSAPKAAPKADSYSVVVNNVSAQELLFALARDARLNVDIHPGISGTVTLNAIDQTLPQILSRISKQIDMRWELDGPNLAVMPDAPFLRNYKIDYVNVSREAQSSLSTSTQIASTGSRSVGGATAGVTGNNSSTTISNTANNRFWETLVQNLRDILRETDKVFSDCLPGEPGAASTTPAAPAAPAASAPQPAPAAAPANTNGTPANNRACMFRESASVISNPESGMIAVRASARQHEKVQEFIDQVLNSVRRQVMIEATIVEVELNDGYQSGVDWQKLALGSGLTFRQNTNGIDLSGANNPLPDATRSALISSIMGDTNLTAQQRSNLVEQIAPGMGTLIVDSSGNLVAAGTPGAKIQPNTSAFSSQGQGFTLGYANNQQFAGAVKMLSTFGNVKVLSSPRLTVMNNQSAVLRVVSNEVYFTVTAQVSQNQTSTQTTYTSTPNTVAVGFVMSVTPQIDDTQTITLNLRPSISRVTSYVKDPNPDLARVSVTSLIPVIQTREVESIMKIPSGQIAVLGGLMQEYAEKNTQGVPGLSGLPMIGNVFSNRNDSVKKTELIVFMRPLSIKDASLDGDYRAFRERMPNGAFFDDLTTSRPQAKNDSAKATEGSLP
jgi:general secretion pathway protein D